MGGREAPKPWVPHRWQMGLGPFGPHLCWHSMRPPQSTRPALGSQQKADLDLPERVQRGPRKWSGGWKNLSCGGRLGELGLFSPEKTFLRPGTIEGGF